MPGFTDVPSIVSPNTKIIFLQADSKFLTIQKKENQPIWFDIVSINQEGQYDENSFNKEDALASAHKIIEVIDEEVKTNLDGNYRRLWIGG